MKKLLIFFISLIIFPLIAFADDSFDNNDNQSSINNITESPETGVEDYFITLGIVSLVLIVGLEIANKKDLFKKI